MSMSRCLVDGHPAEALSITDRAIAYGDGLFETIAVVNGQPQLLAYHLDRLHLGCAGLGIELNTHELNSDLESILMGLDAKQPRVLKIIVSRGAGFRGYSPVGCGPTTRIVQLGSYPDYPTENRTEGVQVKICDHRLSDNPGLAGMKHLNRLDQIRARSEWSGGCYQEGIMLDQKGRPIEGTMSNLFAVLNGKLITPPLECCGVNGVMRRLIVEELASELKLLTLEQTLSWADLYAAEELFLSNSLIGVWPIRQIGCYQKAVGRVSQQLNAKLLERSYCV